MTRREWLSRAWHVFTTTRYTRRLEAEIVFLQVEITRLRTDNDGLVCALYPQVKRIRTEAVVAKDMVRPARKMATFNSL